MSYVVFPGLAQYHSPYLMPGFNKNISKRHDPENINLLVSNYFSQYHHNMRCRKRELVNTRYWAMVMLLLCGYNLTETANFFGKNHATVIHGFKQISADLTYYPHSRKHLAYFLTQINFNPNQIIYKKAKESFSTWKTKQYI